MQVPEGLYCHHLTKYNAGLVILSENPQKPENPRYVKCNPQNVAYLSYHHSKRVATIMSIKVDETRQNHGLATFLLKHLGYLLRNKVDKVCLDDMSDRCNKEHNVYRRLGFQYIKPGHPEMEIDRALLS